MKRSMSFLAGLELKWKITGCPETERSAALAVADGDWHTACQRV